VKNRIETEKISRNALCPGGSGKKYKRCCLGKTPAKSTADLQYAKKYRIQIKTPQQIEGIREAGRLVIETLDLVESHLQPGITTDEINTIIHDFTIQRGAIPAPLN
jgi:methionyl aminopeptidase